MHSDSHELAHLHPDSANRLRAIMLIKQMITDATKTPNWQPQEEDQHLKCSFSIDL